MEITEGAKYRLNLDDGGRIVSVTKVGTDLPIAVDEASQGLAQALTQVFAKGQTAEVQPHRMGYVWEGATFFCDQAAFKRWLLDHGERLHVVFKRHFQYSHYPTVSSGSRVAFANADRRNSPFNSINFEEVLFSYAASEPHQESEVEYDGFAGRAKNVWVSVRLLEEMCKELSRTTSEARRLSAWAVTRTFVYVDLSDFSKSTAGRQADAIATLIRLARSERHWAGLEHGREVLEHIEASICIGDGYIFVFEKPSSALYFAAGLACLIENAGSEDNEIHFRIGVHTGPVRYFWDQACVADSGRWNYVGRGIIEGERVLSSIGKDVDDVVCISADTRRAVLREPEFGAAFAVEKLAQNRGRRSDKHGVLRRLYEINHTGWFGVEVRRAKQDRERRGDA